LGGQDIEVYSSYDRESSSTKFYYVHNENSNSFLSKESQCSKQYTKGNAMKSRDIVECDSGKLLKACTTESEFNKCVEEKCLKKLPLHFTIKSGYNPEEHPDRTNDCVQIETLSSNCRNNLFGSLIYAPKINDIGNADHKKHFMTNINWTLTKPPDDITLEETSQISDFLKANICMAQKGTPMPPDSIFNTLLAYVRHAQYSKWQDPILKKTIKQMTSVKKTVNDADRGVEPSTTDDDESIGDGPSEEARNSVKLQVSEVSSDESDMGQIVNDAGPEGGSSATDDGGTGAKKRKHSRKKKRTKSSHSQKKVAETPDPTLKPIFESAMKKCGYSNDSISKTLVEATMYLSQAGYNKEDHSYDTINGKKMFKFGYTENTMARRAGSGDHSPGSNSCKPIINIYIPGDRKDNCETAIKKILEGFEFISPEYFLVEPVEEPTVMKMFLKAVRPFMSISQR
jgi:hypothetical protein